MQFIKIIFFVIPITVFIFNPGVFGNEKSHIQTDIKYNAKPWIGIKVNNYLKETTKKETNEGVTVKEIVYNNVDLQGLEKGDIIKKIDETKILTVEDFNKIISVKSIGNKVKLEVIRNNERLEIFITLEDVWKKTENVLSNLGLIIKPVKKESAFTVIVEDTVKDSKAEKYGINKDDIILGINRSSFNNMDEFGEIVSHVNLERETYILVMRKEGDNFITVTKQIGEKQETETVEEEEQVIH